MRRYQIDIASREGEQALTRLEEIRALAKKEPIDDNHAIEMLRICGSLSFPGNDGHASMQAAVKAGADLIKLAKFAAKGGIRSVGTMQEAQELAGFGPNADERVANVVYLRGKEGSAGSTKGLIRDRLPVTSDQEGLRLKLEHLREHGDDIDIEMLYAGSTEYTSSRRAQQEHDVAVRDKKKQRKTAGLAADASLAAPLVNTPILQYKGDREDGYRLERAVALLFGIPTLLNQTVPWVKFRASATGAPSGLTLKVEDRAALVPSKLTIVGLDSAITQPLLRGLGLTPSQILEVRHEQVAEDEVKNKRFNDIHRLNRQRNNAITNNAKDAMLKLLGRANHGDTFLVAGILSRYAIVRAFEISPGWTMQHVQHDGSVVSRPPPDVPGGPELRYPGAPAYDVVTHITMPADGDKPSRTISFASLPSANDFVHFDFQELVGNATEEAKVRQLRDITLALGVMGLPVGASRDDIALVQKKCSQDDAEEDEEDEEDEEGSQAGSDMDDDEASEKDGPHIEAATHLSALSKEIIAKDSKRRASRLWDLHPRWRDEEGRWETIKVYGDPKKGYRREITIYRSSELGERDFCLDIAVPESLKGTHVQALIARDTSHAEPAITIWLRPVPQGVPLPLDDEDDDAALRQGAREERRGEERGGDGQDGDHGGEVSGEGMGVNPADSPVVEGAAAPGAGDAPTRCMTYLLGALFARERGSIKTTLWEVCRRGGAFSEAELEVFLNRAALESLFGEGDVIAVGMARRYVPPPAMRNGRPRGGNLPAQTDHVRFVINVPQDVPEGPQGEAQRDSSRIFDGVMRLYVHSVLCSPDAMRPHVHYWATLRLVKGSVHLVVGKAVSESLLALGDDISTIEHTLPMRRDDPRISKAAVVLKMSPLLLEVMSRRMALLDAEVEDRLADAAAARAARAAAGASVDGSEGEAAGTEAGSKGGASNGKKGKGRKEKKEKKGKAPREEGPKIKTPPRRSPMHRWSRDTCDFLLSLIPARYKNFKKLSRSMIGFEAPSSQRDYILDDVGLNRLVREFNACASRDGNGKLHLQKKMLRSMNDAGSKSAEES